jgi:hypothetical protein
MIGIVVVLLAGGAWAITQLFASSPTARHAPKRSSSALALTQFKDPAGAFEGDYPSSWQRLSSSNPSVVVLAAGPQGASILVEKTAIGAKVTSANLAAAQPLANRVVHEANHVKLLRSPQAVTVSGLPGFLYLYTFVDPSTGQVGAHAHYFLFDGKTMITLVFQSLPSNNFVSQAHLFDRLTNSFKTLPH